MIRLKTISFKEWITHFLTGALGAAFILAVYQSFIVPPPKFATIHVTRIMDGFVKSEANKKMSQSELTQEVKNYAKGLESALNHFSQKNHLILIPKEAVVAGMPDETEVFLNALQKNK